MIGVTADSKNPTAGVQDRVNRVSEEFGLEAGSEIDRIEIDYLPQDILAQTRFNGARTELVFNRHRFSRIPEVEKRRTVLHELLHVKQFNNTLSDWLRQRFGVSEEFVKEMSGRTVSDMEGEVELIIDKILPQDLPSSYPHEKERRERELKQKGIDPETELMEDIEKMEQEVMDAYTSGREFSYGAQELSQTGYLDTGFNYQQFQDRYLTDFEESWGEIDGYLGTAENSMQYNTAVKQF